MVNRVLPDAELAEKTLQFAAAPGRRARRWPTTATKRIVRAYLDAGRARAPTSAPRDSAAPLFETEDLQRAVKSFLAEGPGKASFDGMSCFRRRALVASAL